MANREAIRADLEATKILYHQVLDSLSLADWNRKSANRAWTVKQMMSHLAGGLDFTIGNIERARRGKGFNPPSFLADRLNVIITRWGARKATPESVAARYDANHAKLIATLDGIQDDEWQKRGRFFGEEQTIEGLFKRWPAHFHEHAVDIRKGLGQV